MEKKIIFKLLVVLYLSLLIVPNFSIANPMKDSFHCKNISINNQIFFNDYNENITKAMNESFMPSLSVGIIINNTLEWYKGYGKYRGYYNPLIKKSDKTPSKNTIYMAASISKTITATAILQLCEKGQLRITDKVSKFFKNELKNPFYPEVDITVKMLLNHTSSLSDSSFSLVVPVLNRFKGFSEQFIKVLTNCFFGNNKEKIWHKNVIPGKEFHYSNTNYGILQFIIEKISNVKFEEYCDRFIFKPLQMYNTSFHYKDFKLCRQAMPYFWINKSQYYLRLRHYDIPLLGAGSLRTTVEDLSHFLIAHMNHGNYNGARILNQTSIEKMHNPSVEIEDELFNIFYQKYGLGWMIYNGSIYSGHGGDTYGSHGQMMMDETNKTGIIYFWNSTEISNRSVEERISARKKLESEFFKIIKNFQ